MTLSNILRVLAQDSAPSSRFFPAGCLPQGSVRGGKPGLRVPEFIAKKLSAAADTLTCVKTGNIRQTSQRPLFSHSAESSKRRLIL